jgi:membrane protease YdiL (CAAX protease family)
LSVFRGWQLACLLSFCFEDRIHSRDLASEDPAAGMTQHPLVRCALFIVLFALLIGLFSRVPQSLYSNAALNATAAIVATGLMLVLEQRGPSFIGLSREPGWWQQILGGIALGAGMIALVAVAMIASEHLQWQAQDFPAARWAEMAGVFLAAAAFEELLFRGYGFQRLVEGIGRWPALIALSLFFAAGHRNNPGAGWPGLANTVLVGLVFGLAYLRTRQLWLPIAWHWSWNLMEASLGFPVSGIKFSAMPLLAVETGSPLWTGASYGPEAALPVTLVLLAGLVLVLRLRQVQSNAS